MQEEAKKLITHLKKHFTLREKDDICYELRQNELVATVQYVEDVDAWQIALHEFHGFDVVLTKFEVWVNKEWEEVKVDYPMMWNFPPSLDEYMEERMRKIKPSRI